MPLANKFGLFGWQSASYHPAHDAHWDYSDYLVLKLISPIRWHQKSRLAVDPSLKLYLILWNRFNSIGIWVMFSASRALHCLWWLDSSVLQDHSPITDPPWFLSSFRMELLLSKLDIRRRKWPWSSFWRMKMSNTFCSPSSCLPVHLSSALSREPSTHTWRSHSFIPYHTSKHMSSSPCQYLSIHRPLSIPKFRLWPRIIISKHCFSHLLARWWFLQISFGVPLDFSCWFSGSLFILWWKFWPLLLRWCSSNCGTTIANIPKLLFNSLISGSLRFLPIPWCRCKCQHSTMSPSRISFWNMLALLKSVLQSWPRKINRLSHLSFLS